MAWVKKNDRSPWSKKLSPLSDMAYRLYDHALHYSASEESDGTILLSLIPVVIAGIKGKNIKAAIVELTAGRLWHTPGDRCDSEVCPAHERDTCEASWDIHNYFEYNKTHAELEADRATARARMKRQRSTDVRPNIEGTADSVPIPRPVPSRPVPSGEGLLPAAPLTTTRDPELNHLLAGWYEMTGRQPNVDDDKAASVALVSLHRFDADRMLSLLQGKVAERNAALKPTKSFAYLLPFLQQAHDELAEARSA